MILIVCKFVISLLAIVSVRLSYKGVLERPEILPAAAIAERNRRITLAIHINSNWDLLR